MNKWKKICYGCLPFLAAIVLMYVLTFLFLMGSGFVWGLFHYEQIKGDGGMVASLFADEAWLGKVQILGSCFVYIVFLFVFGIWYKRKFFLSEHLRAGTWGIPMFAGILVFGISVQCLCSYALSLILPLFPETNRRYMELMDSMGTGKGIMPLLYMGILAPIVEELIFRGLVLGYEKRELPFWCANFIQAFLFGLYHQNIVQFVYAFCIGLFLGYLCQRLQSLKLIMVIHGVINISGNLLVYFKLDLLAESKAAMVMVILVSMVFAVLSYLFLLRGREKSVSGKKEA